MHQKKTNEEILEQLELLAQEWESKPYDGDLTQAVYQVCAAEIRKMLDKFTS